MSGFPRRSGVKGRQGVLLRRARTLDAVEALIRWTREWAGRAYGIARACLGIPSQRRNPPPPCLAASVPHLQHGPGPVAQVGGVRPDLASFDVHAMRIRRQLSFGVAFGRALFALRANRAGMPSRPMRVTVADACALRAPRRPLAAPLNRPVAAGRVGRLV